MNNSIFLIITAIALIALVICFIKFEGFRVFTGAALACILAFSGVYSGIKIFSYYNAKSDIIGKITSIFKPNEVDVSESETIDFKIKNVNFSKNNSDKYSIDIESEKTMSLSSEECFTLAVNENPCQIEFSDKNSVKATYTYLFKDETGAEIEIDTITISIAFYKNYSRLIFELEDDSSVNLWESYFQKNDFIISAKKVKSDDISFVSLKTVDFVDEKGKTLFKVKLKSGSNYIFPESIDLEKFELEHYEKDGEEIKELKNITEDTTITVFLTARIKISVWLGLSDFPDKNSEIYANDLGEYDFKSGVTVGEITAKLKENELFLKRLSLKSPIGYIFFGLKTKPGILYNISDAEPETIVSEDTTLYTVWQAEKSPLTIISNGVEYKFNDDLKSENSDFSVAFDENFKITILKQDKVFAIKYYFENFPEKTYETAYTKPGEYEFSIKQLYNNLFGLHYGADEYHDEVQIPYSEVGKLIIEILEKEAEPEVEDWKNSYSEEQLAEILKQENNINTVYDFNYGEPTREIWTEPKSEEEYLKFFISCISKKEDDFFIDKSIADLQKIIFEIVNSTVEPDLVWTEQLEFIDFLKTIYKAVKGGEKLQGYWLFNDEISNSLSSLKYSYSSGNSKFSGIEFVAGNQRFNELNFVEIEAEISYLNEISPCWFIDEIPFSINNIPFKIYGIQTTLEQDSFDSNYGTSAIITSKRLDIEIELVPGVGIKLKNVGELHCAYTLQIENGNDEELKKFFNCETTGVVESGKDLILNFTEKYAQCENFSSTDYNYLLYDIDIENAQSGEQTEVLNSEGWQDENSRLLYIKTEYSEDLIEFYNFLLKYATKL